MIALNQYLPNAGYIYQSQIEIYIVSFILFSVAIRLAVSFIKILGCIRIPYHLTASRIHFYRTVSYIASRIDDFRRRNLLVESHEIKLAARLEMLRLENMIVENSQAVLNELYASISPSKSSRKLMDVANNLVFECPQKLSNHSTTRLTKCLSDGLVAFLNERVKKLNLWELEICKFIEKDLQSDNIKDQDKNLPIYEKLMESHSKIRDSIKEFGDNIQNKNEEIEKTIKEINEKGGMNQPGNVKEKNFDEKHYKECLTNMNKTEKEYFKMLETFEKFEKQAKERNGYDIPEASEHDRVDYRKEDFLFYVRRIDHTRKEVEVLTKKNRDLKEQTDDGKTSNNKDISAIIEELDKKIKSKKDQLEALNNKNPELMENFETLNDLKNVKIKT